MEISVCRNQRIKIKKQGTVIQYKKFCKDFYVNELPQTRKKEAKSEQM